MRRPKVDFVFGDEETQTIAGVIDEFAAALGETGLGRLRLDDFDSGNLNWIERCGWQIHHCGGTRMSDDPANGVVDADCRVHGMENLFIAGSSVFPTCGHANPTVNLLALTYRLADKLQSEFQR